LRWPATAFLRACQPGADKSGASKFPCSKGCSSAAAIAPPEPERGSRAAAIAHQVRKSAKYTDPCTTPISGGATTDRALDRSTFLSGRSRPGRSRGTDVLKVEEEDSLFHSAIGIARLARASRRPIPQRTPKKLLWRSLAASGKSFPARRFPSNWITDIPS
jgi:hypothetical protein